jgi:hypothetical protein
MPAWSNYANGVLFAPSTAYPNYDEPIMGNAPNCSCIASMSSYAWTSPQVLKLQRLSNMTQIIFPNAGTVQMTSLLWLEGGNFVYSRDLYSPASNYEIWPSLYEKAYKKIIQGITTSLPEPNMAEANWYNFSLTPLQYMTGWAPDLTNLAGMSVGAVETKLGSCCEWDANNSAQTKYPGIAWTAAAAGTNPAGQIYQNHSYSILGLYSDAAGQKWVILRDPKRTPGNPAGALNLPNGVWPVYYGWYNKGIGKINPHNITVPLSNGTFGITTTTFKNLFSAFGFVR